MPDIDLSPQLNIEAVIVLAAAIAVTIVINFVIPVLSYPFRLFFTMIHELAHVFAVRLTGGEVGDFSVSRDAGGLTKFRGGDPIMIYLAGYMGTTLFSAGLILLSGYPVLAPYILGFLGGLLVLLIMLHAERTLLTVFIGVIFGIGLIGVAWLADLIWSVFLLNLLAVQGAYIALEHLEVLADNLSEGDDANQMANLVGCAPIFWARLWSILSILIMGAAFWFTWIRNLSA
jgi:hypothetical protein